MRKRTYRSTSRKSLHNPSFLIRLKHLIDSVLPLHNLQLTRQPLPRKLNHTASRHTVQNQLIIQRRRDKLELALLCPPEHEKVARASLGAVSLRSIQPQDLAETSTPRLGSGQQTGSVVGTNLGITEAANPRADHVLGVGVQLHTTLRQIHARHEADGDEKKRFLGSLDTELGLCANHGGADIQEGAGSLLGKPLWPVDGHENLDELLKLLGVETWQGDTEGGHEHALGVAVGAEEAELAVVAAEGLEALEALGGVVEDGGGGHEGERAVGLELGVGPALGGGPGDGDHVVGADGLVARVGLGLGGNGASIRVGAGDGDLGGVEGRERGNSMAVGAVAVAVESGLLGYPVVEGGDGEVLRGALLRDGHVGGFVYVCLFGRGGSWLGDSVSENKERCCLCFNM